MQSIGLCTPSRGFKPLRYEWAMEMWRRQQQLHWMPEEVPLGEDVRDWRSKLTGPEKHLLTHIFRFFTQADIDVNDNYMDRYAAVFRPNEVRMMLAAFSNMETVHVSAYALLIDTLGMPEAAYTEFLDYKAMRDKHEHAIKFDVQSPEETLLTLANFGALTEGLQLFASFAILLSFPKRGLMKGMGQIVTWSVRDETLHCEGITRLFHQYARETGALTEDLKERIRALADNVVTLEDRFAELAFEQGPVVGMSLEDVKRYVRYVCDWRLGQLGVAPLYDIKVHPLPWLPSILNNVEHANFFETRATEYSKGATRGSWDETWGRFDAPKIAVAA